MGFRAVKDPDAVLQYTFDWTAWLTGSETLTDATVTADTGLDVSAVTNDTTAVTFTLSGGTVGERYKVVCHITTSAGQQNDDTLVVDVRDR